MSGFRIFLVLAIATAATLLAFIFFKDDLIRRAQPPQATIAPVAAPAASSESKPELLVDDVAPVFDAVRVSRNCLATIAGRATPGALVTVRAEQRELGRVTTNAQGEWALVPDLPLEKGSRELSLRAERAGAKPVESESVVVVEVPECRAGDVLAGEQAVAVISSNTGSARLLQPSDNDKEADPGSATTLDTMDFDRSGGFMVSGRAPARTEVQVYLNARPIGVASAGSNGRWDLKLNETVSPGIYTLRAVPIEDKGKIVARADLPVERAARAAKAEGKAKMKAAASTGGKITVERGQTLWSISEQVYGDGNKYRLILAANSNILTDASQLRAGQVLVIPKAEAKPARKPKAKAPTKDKTPAKPAGN